MKVELLHVTPMHVLVKAIRKCYGSGDRSDSQTIEGEYILGVKDKELIIKVIDSDHLSTIEHVNFTFDMSGYSRALLQEKSRHRIMSPSERSTRYCLKKMKTENTFIGASREKLEQYIVFTGEEMVDNFSVLALENLRLCIVAEIPNDKAKYCLPDSLISECILTTNARSLRNFLKLRSNIRALWEIRLMAQLTYESIPNQYKFLFDNCMYKED